MIISATQLKTNTGRYLRRASTEDVFVTMNGKVIATISNPSRDKQALLDSLVGIASSSPVTLEQARAERLKRQ